MRLGSTSPFDLTWRAHWAFDRGHSLGSPPPPKLAQAVELMEQELRARTALMAEAAEERARRAENSGGVIAEG